MELFETFIKSLKENLKKIKIELIAKPLKKINIFIFFLNRTLWNLLEFY